MTEVYAIDLTDGAPEWPEEKKWHWREQVCYFFPRQMRELQRLPVSATQWRLLLALMGHCDWGNICRVSSAQLGRDIGRSGTWVARVLRSLPPTQLLILETAHGRKDQTIVLSPLLCWKGRPWHLSYARRQFLAAWALRYGHGPGMAHDHDGSLPGPRVRATASLEPPPPGSADPGAAPFLPHPPQAPVG